MQCHTRIKINRTKYQDFVNMFVKINKNEFKHLGICLKINSMLNIPIHPTYVLLKFIFLLLLL